MGNVSYYSDSCLLNSDFSLANTPEGFCKSLKKSLFGLHRPARAEIRPKPVWSIDVMAGSVAEAGKTSRPK
jgi:hypothetical protein